MQFSTTEATVIKDNGPLIFLLNPGPEPTSLERLPTLRNKLVSRCVQSGSPGSRWESNAMPLPWRGK